MRYLVSQRPSDTRRLTRIGTHRDGDSMHSTCRGSNQTNASTGKGTNTGPTHRQDADCSWCLLRKGKPVFSSGISLGLSTLLHKDPMSSSSWPIQKRFYAAVGFVCVSVYARFWFYFGISCLVFFFLICLCFYFSETEKRKHEVGRGGENLG